MKPSHKISQTKQVEQLKRLVIQSHIAAHPMILKNTLIPEATASALVKHFEINWQDNDTPVITPKENAFSAKAAGVWANIDEQIENLLQTKYKSHLLPEDNGEPRQVQSNDRPYGAPESVPSEQLKQTNDNYEKAKERGDGPAMIACKRRAAEQGKIIL